MIFKNFYVELSNNEELDNNKISLIIYFCKNGFYKNEYHKNFIINL